MFHPALRRHAVGAGISEKRGTLFGGPFKGILFYLGYRRGTPILRNAHIYTVETASVLPPVDWKELLRSTNLGGRVESLGFRV